MRHGASAREAVIARLDRATQYAAPFEIRRNTSAYWVPRFRGGMTS
jgi:hypothetical protein